MVYNKQEIKNDIAKERRCGFAMTLSVQFFCGKLLKPRTELRQSKCVDMRVPFQISLKDIKDADKVRSKVFGLVKFEEHTQQETSLQDMRKAHFWLYMFPQEGQKRLLQEKGTNLRLPQ